ncbi:MAG: ABC-F family ATP-binding cassette domain-containing protein [Cytophagales bacterium]|nr:ABC-F family ATP-binding cassette domain-containing protein [Cytophagales bacterium]
MNLLSAENLGKIYGDKWLFRNIYFGINQGQKIGVIGKNGCGKSTFLKILAGIHPADEGNMSMRKGVTVGYLGQNPIFDDTKTVFDNLYTSNNEIITAIKNYENALQDGDTESQYFHDCIENMNRLGAWEFDNMIKEIISRLGIGEFIQRYTGVLSGGQRKKVALAQLFINKPDVIILDEPTNHLDLEMVEWLENFLNEHFSTILLVTHDRYFLDNLTDQIIEIDNGSLSTFKGGYEYYLEKKAMATEIKEAEIDKAQNLMRRELDWVRRQPKARGTKAKYRLDAFEDTKAKASQKIENTKVVLDVKTTRQGGNILEVRKLAKSYGNTILFEGFSYIFKKGEKTGIIGKNGTGKTTLIEILAGRVKQDAGEVLWGQTSVVGYFKQEDDEHLKDDKRIIDIVKEIAEYIALSDGSRLSVSQFMARFLFPPSEQYKYYSALSGGEKRRLQLLKILITNPNFIILDEPTNDLDIPTLQVLEEFLAHFQGSLIIISHDRYFMDRLVDHLFIFEQGKPIKDFPGNYTQYRDSKKAGVETKNASILEIPEDKPLNIKDIPTEKRKLSYNEQREIEKIEKDIANLEVQKQELILKLQSGLTHEEMKHTADKISNIEKNLEIISHRWLELAELQ